MKEGSRISYEIRRIEYMYDFYDRLMKGESAEDIAKSITEELNKAQVKRTEELKAKAAESKREQTKLADAEAICAGLMKFAKDYYGYDIEVKTEDLMKVFDMADKIGRAIEDLGKTVEKPAEKVKAKVYKVNGSADEVIDKFLNLMGW